MAVVADEGYPGVAGTKLLRCDQRSPEPPSLGLFEGL